MTCYDNCWKRMYFERHLEESLETFVPPDLSSSMHIDSMKDVGIVTGGGAATIIMHVPDCIFAGVVQPICEKAGH